MQNHCVIGERILREQSKAMAPLLSRYFTESNVENSPDPILETAASIALSHHEKWDGSGYPQKLAGERVPQEARIVAIADVFDALCNERPYKPAYPEEKALEIIRSGAGSHFDPDVYGAFLKALPELRSIRDSYSDDIDMICDTRR
jgi:putative two-component system response regulator